jgi:hypothetical protein
MIFFATEVALIPPIAILLRLILTFSCAGVPRQSQR